MFAVISQTFLLISLLSLVFVTYIMTYINTASIHLNSLNSTHICQQKKYLLLANYKIYRLNLMRSMA